MSFDFFSALKRLIAAQSSKSKGMDFSVPILRLHNESSTKPLDILVEPHLELFELQPGKTCDVFYSHRPDNRVPGRTLEIAQRDDCIVVYPPGVFAPVFMSEGKPLRNRWADDASQDSPAAL